MAVPGGTGGWRESRPSHEYCSVDGADVFRRQSLNDEQEDFAALMESAMEGLSHKKRKHAAVLPITDEESRLSRFEVIRADQLKPEQSRMLLDLVMGSSASDNEAFLKRLKERMDRAGVPTPKIEVKFRDLSVHAQVYAGSRANPSLINTVRNVVEDWVLNPLHLTHNQRATFPILRGVSGTLEPGRLTLLLGPPGAGKSTLLKALSGKLTTSAKGLEATGDITYNDRHFNEFVVQRTAGYVGQVDLHTGELTVRETLNFAAQFQGVGHKYESFQLLRDRAKKLKLPPDPELDAFLTAAAVMGAKGAKHHVVTEYMLKILGLEHVADTVIGSDMKRGISGGQRKRVTIGEIIVGPAKTLFMDEISTGLDASTTYQLVKSTRNFVHSREGTVLMALLQPPPEVFDLFDDIMLLSEGLIVYHGPREGVVPFFESMGFRCPERKGVADFLQEVTSIKEQLQYWAGEGPYRYISVLEFAEAFKRSQRGTANAERLVKPYDRSQEKVDGLVYHKYALSNWQMMKTMLRQDLILLKRNTFLYTFRTSQVLLTAFFVSTLFLRTTLSPTSVIHGQYYLGVLFFSLIHMQFNGFSEMSLIVAELPVFFKKRDALFYPAWVFALPTTILRLPVSLLEAIVYSCLVYWVVGLAPDAGRFFAFFFLMFLMHAMSVALFRMIGALARTQEVASTLGSLALLIVFMLGGFILAKDYIPPWYIWGFWISPLMYAQQAVSANEFTAPRWQVPTPGDPSTPLGQSVLAGRSLFFERWWTFVGFAALIGYFCLFTGVTLLALKFLNMYTGAAAVLSEEDIKARTEPEALSNKYHEGSSKEQVDNFAIEMPRINQPVKQAADGNHEVSSSATNTEDAAVSVFDSGIPFPHSHKKSSGQQGESAGHGMILPFEPLVMTFKNVDYYVPNPNAGGETVDGSIMPNELQLLKHVSGSFRPHILTALVGASGAGKTTLMDVLAGRKTVGRIEGEITVGGFAKQQETFARILGYVEQEDIHSPQLTVIESLLFSARTRLSGVDKKTASNFAREVLALVELDPLATALVGLPGRSGLSVEQRKRLTIGVELVANPSIVFMDEPTSGLDARAAAIVMRAVRNTVNTGRTVVCTIHQPSIDIFDSFDELLLMKRGGRIIYHGPLGTHSQCIIDYFMAIEGVEPITPGLNPATWMLEISNPQAEKQLGIDFAEVFNHSDMNKRNLQLVDGMSKPAPGAKPLHFDTVYARNAWSQFTLLTKKFNFIYWRSPGYNLVRLVMTVVIALLFGSIFWGKGYRRNTFTEVLNVMGTLYGAVLFLGVQNSSTVQPVLSVEKTVFYRERAAGMYGALPFAFALGVIELPYILVQTVVYSVITYSMIQFEWTGAKFGWYLLTMFLTLVVFTFYGTTAIAITASLQLGAVLSSTFYGLWNLFAGFLLPHPAMPGWWTWYWYLNPLSWTLYGLVASQLGDVNAPIAAAPGQPPQTVAQYVEGYFGYTQGYLGQVAAILIGFCALFWLLTAAGLKYLNFRRR